MPTCEPIPAPEVPARPAQLDEIPRGAVTVMRLAERNGWTVRPTYARGPLLGARGNVLRITTSIALRMSHPSHLGAVGLWFAQPSGKYVYEGGYTWRLDGMITPADAARLKAFIAQNETLADSSAPAG